MSISMILFMRAKPMTMPPSVDRRTAAQPRPRPARNDGNSFAGRELDDLDDVPGRGG